MRVSTAKGKALASLICLAIVLCMATLALALAAHAADASQMGGGDPAGEVSSMSKKKFTLRKATGMYFTSDWEHCKMKIKGNTLYIYAPMDRYKRTKEFRKFAKSYKGYSKFKLTGDTVFDGLYNDNRHMMTKSKFKKKFKNKSYPYYVTVENGVATYVTNWHAD